MAKSGNVRLGTVRQERRGSLWFVSAASGMVGFNKVRQVAWGQAARGGVRWSTVWFGKAGLVWQVTIRFGLV